MSYSRRLEEYSLRYAVIGDDPRQWKRQVNLTLFAPGRI